MLVDTLLFLLCVILAVMALITLVFGYCVLRLTIRGYRDQMSALKTARENDNGDGSTTGTV